MTARPRAGERDAAADEPFALYASETNAHDKLYNSRSGLAALYAFQPRDVAELHREHDPDGAPARIDRTVIERVGRRTFAYSPWNLPTTLELANDVTDAPSLAAELAGRWLASDGARTATIKTIRSRAKKQTAWQTNVKLMLVGAIYIVVVAGAVDLVKAWHALAAVAIAVVAAAVVHWGIDKRFSVEIARRASAIWWPIVFPPPPDADARGAFAGAAEQEHGYLKAALLLAIGAIAFLAMRLLDWSAVWPPLLLAVALYAGGKLSYRLAGFRERRCRESAGRDLQRRKLGYDAAKARDYLETLSELRPGSAPDASTPPPADPPGGLDRPVPTALDDYERALRIDRLLVLLYSAGLCTLLVVVLGKNGPIGFPIALVIIYLFADLYEDALLLRAVRAIKLAHRDALLAQRPSGDRSAQAGSPVAGGSVTHQEAIAAGRLSDKRLAETLLAASFWTVVKFWMIPAVLIFVVLAGSVDLKTGRSESNALPAATTSPAPAEPPRAR